jgi:uncharacterized FlgJ-related protein
MYHEGKIKNESMRDEAQTYSKKDKLDETRIKWKEYVARMDELPKAVMR